MLNSLVTLMNSRMLFRNALLSGLVVAAAVLLVTGPSSAGDGSVVLFDGKTLDGWQVRGGKATYRIEDGMIVGTTADGAPNTFLCKGPFGDFELEFEVLCDKELNSGVQIRSHVYLKDTPQESNPKRVRKAGEVYGYQCEIAEAGKGTSGNFWTRPAARSGSTTSRTSPRPARPSRTASGTATGSWRRAITSARG